MSLVAVILVFVGIYLFLKVAGFVLKLAILLVVILALYRLVAPHIGAPALF